jgi:hypothetical protein
MAIPLSSLLASRKCSRSPDVARDIKGKRKAEAEPDTDHEQRQRNVGDSKRLKIDRDQGIHHILVSC